MMMCEYVRMVALGSVPVALKIQEIEKVSAEDEELQVVCGCLVSGNWEGAPKSYVYVRNELTFIGHVILHGMPIVIPRKLRERVLRLAHEGHQGIVKMKERLRSKVWRPGVDKDAERKCRECYGCQLVTKEAIIPPVKTTRLPERPWQDLALDLLGPLPTGEHLLVLVDYFSHWVEVDVIHSTTSEVIIKCLDKQFCGYGVPRTLRTDNRTNLVSAEMDGYLTEVGIRRRLTIPLWPRANGEVKRQNRSLLKAMRVAQAERKNWRSELNKYLLAYHSTPHTMTGTSPAELLYGWKLSTKLPELADFGDSDEATHPEVRDRDAEKKQRGAGYVDKKHHAADRPDVQDGELVLHEKQKETKLSKNYEKEPYKVVERHGDQIKLKSSQGAVYKRNIQHVKRFVGPVTDPGELDSSGVVVRSVPEQNFGQEASPNPTVEASAIPLEEQSPVQAEPLPRRSRRVTRPPERFKEYVTV